MKAVGLLALVTIVAASAFFVGRKSAEVPAPVERANPPVEAAQPRVPAPSAPMAPSPGEHDRALMSALNALQSGVSTGVNREQYSELIGAARTKLADLKLFSETSVLIPPAEAYLEAHATALSIWINNTGTESRIYVSETDDPLFFHFIKRALPNQPLVSMALPTKMYELENVGALWSFTEGKPWADIEKAWQALNAPGPS